MKKLVIILTAVVMLFSASAFAFGSENVSSYIKSVFQKDFLKAENVSWRKISDFSFATFKMNNANVEVAYNVEGELVAMSREVDAAQLPLSISRSLAKKYDSYTLSDKALELNFDGETYYYITATNSKHTLKLKCSTSGNISIESKIKRK